MEQADLRQWERQCIQEETPRCVAACPIHVDAKLFCSLMGQRRWDKAWQVLAKTMPLPGVLARLCDAPCESACVRKDAGGAVELGELERYCAENAKPVPPPKPLPSRGKRVAVVGDGMSGLSGAWEMARRGFDVTLYSSEPGRHLREALGERLPDGVLERELASLVTLGVRFDKEMKVSPSVLDSLLEEADAVFLDSDAISSDLLPAEVPDEITLGVPRLGLFVAPKGEASPVLQAAAGRRAANSIERFTQGVSMVSGREREGAYATRLFTSLEKVESVAPVAVESDSELTARDEARRCLQCECLECVKVCEYLRHYKSYPKVYVRQIYNNESIVMGTRQANTMINSCMLCGLCETVCPEDFDMAEVCLQARRTMVEKGKMPPSAHEFALRDMAFANGEQCVVAEHAPGADASEYAFFPGCQLTASDPDGVEKAYADLRGRIGNVGLLLHCCGAPAHWAGREDLEAETAASLVDKWEALGRPKLIVSCPSCVKTLRHQLPDAEITSHWSLLRAIGLPQGIAGGGAFAVNDPCAARHEPLMREDVRALLDQMEIAVTEPELTGQTTECCGYGGLLSEANPQLAKRVAQRRAAAADEDFVTYCVMCRDQMARVGKRAVHLYDLLFPARSRCACRPSPGYSDRRENRIRLRERLLRELWRKEMDGETDPADAIDVSFTEEALEAMDERRILKTDIRKVLLQARNSGKWFVHRETGRFLASFRPSIVTYWAVFENHEGGYLVHDAWSHRMRIKGGQP
jgi:Fe-S oxidoreductase